MTDDAKLRDDWIENYVGMAYGDAQDKAVARVAARYAWDAARTHLVGLQDEEVDRDNAFQVRMVYERFCFSKIEDAKAIFDSGWAAMAARMPAVWFWRKKAEDLEKDLREARAPDTAKVKAYEAALTEISEFTDGPHSLPGGSMTEGDPTEEAEIAIRVLRKFAKKGEL